MSEAGELRGAAGGGAKRFDAAVSKALALTVVWDRPELARNMLARVGGQSDETGARLEVAYALQRALELQRGRMVEALLALPAVDTSRVNMGRLFTQPDKLKFLRNNRALQARLNLHVSKRPYSQDLDSRATQLSSYVDFKTAVYPFYNSVSPVLGRLLRAHHSTQRIDIFFWLVCNGNESLCRALWAECHLPVHMMLLAAMLCRHMSKTVKQHAGDLAERAERLHSWASGALGMAAEEAEAHQVLELRACERWTAIDIAAHTGAKEFISHPYCVSLVDRWWRGAFAESTAELEPHFSWLKTLAQVVFPFLHPDVRQPRKRKDTVGQGRSNVYDAIAVYLNITNSEREKLGPLGRRRASRASFKRSAIQTVVEMNDTEQTLYTKQRTPLASFYAIPAVRFLMRFFFHLSLTVLYILLIFVTFEDVETLDERRDDPAVPWADKLPLLTDRSRHRWIEVLWLVFAVGQWLDRRHQSRMRTDHVALGSHGMSRTLALGSFELLFDLITILAIVIRLSMDAKAASLGADPPPCCVQPCDERCELYDEGRDLYRVYEALIAFKFMQVAFGWLQYLNDYEPLGVLIIMVGEMVGDVVNFIILYLVVSVAFMVAGSALQTAAFYDPDNTYGEPGPGAPFKEMGAFWLPMWMTFGVVPVTEFTFLTAPFGWVYLFISCIGLPAPAVGHLACLAIALHNHGHSIRSLV